MGCVILVIFSGFVGLGGFTGLAFDYFGVVCVGGLF